MNINGIKERHKQDEIDMHKISKGQLHEDRAYLLSLIEQAEKALDRVYMNHGYIYVSEALQAIRKGD